jgi:hypothetical protein
VPRRPLAASGGHLNLLCQQQLVLVGCRQTHHLLYHPYLAEAPPVLHQKLTLLWRDAVFTALGLDERCQAEDK